MHPHRLLASLVANFARRTLRPAWCTYLVTLRCNARCRMCDSWRLPRQREMSVEQVAAVFAALGDLDVVRLSGGEPFLRHDLLDLAEAIDAASHPLVLHITTNGSLPEAVESFAASFRRPRALQFLVSLDGLPGEHDANRGTAASFAHAEETVRRLVRLRGRRGFHVSVNHTVISPGSLADAPALQAHFAALGVEVSTVLAYADSATYSLGHCRHTGAPTHPARGYPLHPALQGCDVHTRVAAELERTRHLRTFWLRMGKRYYLAGLLARLRDETAPLPSPPCVALRRHLRLLPDGRVPVCQFNGEVVGNVTLSSINEVWRSPAAHRARRWVDSCPGCWAECEVIPNAIYSGDLLKFVCFHRFFAPSS